MLDKREAQARQMGVVGRLIWHLRNIDLASQVIQSSRIHSCLFRFGAWKLNKQEAPGRHAGIVGKSIWNLGNIASGI